MREARPAIAAGQVKRRGHPKKRHAQGGLAYRRLRLDGRRLMLLRLEARLRRQSRNTQQVPMHWRATDLLNHAVRTSLMTLGVTVIGIFSAAQNRQRQVVTARRLGDSASATSAGGADHENREKKLPPGRYKEYDIDKRPPKPQRRNKRRIVVEFGKKAAYYTRDHYETFTRMKWPH
jgi:guanyl-specific ribonuclease Sa